METAELVAILAAANSTMKHALYCALELRSPPIGLRMQDFTPKPLRTHLLETLDMLQDLIDGARHELQDGKKE